ncbi:hypothetical protein BU23DRAFT_166488, partial [Bimuria novae-zelandiae CBS 107.79]
PKIISLPLLILKNYCTAARIARHADKVPRFRSSKSLISSTIFPIFPNRPMQVKMTFSLLLFITRKPTLTPAEFKAHWDNTHVELLKSIAGDKFPLTHTRRYIARTEDNGTWNAAVIAGTQDDFT